MLTLQGSPLSWEEVLDRYSPLVFRLAWQSLGNRQDAEDAAQEVFVALVRSSPSFRDETHLRAWLIRTTSHRCKNLAASAWKRHTVPLDPDWTPPAGDLPQAGAVLSAVGRLPEKYRTAVYLGVHGRGDRRSAGLSQGYGALPAHAGQEAAARSAEGGI